MNRVALTIQIALATTLTVLWLRWNPFSRECPSEAECSPFVPVERASPSVEPLPPEGTPPDPVFATDTPLSVEYGGCALVMALGADQEQCIYEPGAELRVWVSHRRADEARVEIDGQEHSARRYTQSEEPGLGLRVLVSGPEVERLVVRVEGEEPWVLQLRALDRMTDREARGREQSIERIIVLEQSLVDGRVKDAASIGRTIDEIYALGLLSDAVESTLAAVFHLAEMKEVEEAMALLDRYGPVAQRYPRGRAAWSIYRGTALLSQGRLVDAAAEYRVGGRYAVRMDDAGLQIDSLSHYSMALAELGYFEASVYWGTAALEQAREHGRRVDLVGTLGSVIEANFQLRDAEQAHEELGPLLRSYLELSGRADFFHLGMARLALLDERPAQALEHLESATGRRGPTTLTPEERAWAAELRLRAEMSQASRERGEVGASLAELEALTDGIADRELRWQTELLRGMVLERDGDLPAAQGAYEAAEAILDRAVPTALVGVSGEVAPARRRESAHRLASVLLAQERPEQALCTLREAQSRVGTLAQLFYRLDEGARSSLRPRIEEYLAAKHEYEDRLVGAEELPSTERRRARQEAARLRLQLDRDALEILATRTGYQAHPSCDDLSARSPGELLLGIYPYRDELIVIAQDDAEITYRVLADYESLTRSGKTTWLSSVLLNPLSERLDHATRVRVLASGEAAAIDVHALPFRGGILVQHVPVVYGLDLPPPLRRGGESATRALVLVDALAKGARGEERQVRGQLQHGGWEVESRDSSGVSTSELRQALSAVGHLHYAGHAYYDAGAGSRRAGGASALDEPVLRLWPPYPGGAASEPSYLPLGRRGRLDVQDILMMEHVPRSVVLMGCVTGVHDERMAYGGFSLATAFLGAGAEVVIASTREVDGSDAALVGRGLYAELDGERVREPGAWLRNAMLRALDDGLSEEALRDYRAYVP